MALRTWRLTFALLLAWASGGAGPQVAAQEPSGTRIELEAKLPRALERCVSAEQLEASYERARQSRVAADTRSRPLQSTEFKVQIRSLGTSGGATQVELSAQSGSRSLGTRALPVRADDCKALPDTLALVLWLLSQSAEPEPEPPPTPPQPPAAAAAAPRDPEIPPGQGPPPPPPPSAPSTTHFGLGVGGALSLGVLPRAAWQLQVLAVLRVPIFEGRLRAAVLWPQTLSVAEGRVTMRSYDVALEICPRWRASAAPRLELRACLGPRFGLLRASSAEFAVENTSNTELLVYAGSTAEASLGVTDSSWLELGAGLGIALRRPRFILNFETAQPPMPIAGPMVLRGEFGLSFVQIF